MAENTIKSADVAAKVADREFVRAFDEDIRKLVEILGIFEPIRRAPNTALKYYETSGTLQSGVVGEAEDIPLSKYTRSGEHIASLSWNKWAKETTLEAISANSYEEAVRQTDKKFIMDIQKGIRNQMFNFLKTGTGRITLGGDSQVVASTLQPTLANIWAQMQIDLAIDEIFGTIAHYAYPDQPGMATVRYDFDEASRLFSITFLDQGIPFDPLKQIDPDTSLGVEEREIGGLGIFLVKKTMDDISYQYRDGCNILCLKKTI